MPATSEECEECGQLRQRNLEAAMAAVMETIKQQLVVSPPGPSVQNLTDTHVRNLAAHIVSSIDEYGR
jgi:hypothetical protein